jgi:HSP20 family protein
MNLVTFNPEQTLDSFFDTDRFFGFPRANLDHPTVLPKVNVIEKDEAFHIEAETPGMTVKDVSIEFHSGVLTLKGHREHNSETEKNDYSIREFSHQSFERNFRLSDQIDSEKVTARMDQGILKITLPKKEQAKPKKIEIKLKS